MVDFLADHPMFAKRDAEVAHQLMARYRASPMGLLNKFLNYEDGEENGYLVVDPKNIRKDSDLTSLPEVQQLLLERERVMPDLTQKEVKARSSNEGKSMYYNHILGDLGKRGR